MSAAHNGGKCIYKNKKFDYVIKELEYIPEKSLKIEAVCYDSISDVVLQHSSNDLVNVNELNNICISVIESLIKRLDINKYDLIKLVVRDGKTFYMYRVK